MSGRADLGEALRHVPGAWTGTGTQQTRTPEAPAGPSRPRRQAADGGRAGFRPDVEGLRAFAVLSVLTYHLSPTWLPGGFAGVDVFFVISGYLITTHLAGEAARSGAVALSRFYGRRILRLLPASTVVIVVTAAATFVLAPRFVWRQFGLDSIAAGSYSLNWTLAARSVDYLAQDAVPSAVQHYWSLAVEEQFYLVWPLLVLGLVRLARRRSWAARPVLAGGAALVALASFAAAAHAVHVGQASAYFTTTTRLWELAVGALLALGVPWARGRLAAGVRTLLAGFGLLALVGSVVLLSGHGWPAWPALVPTLGAASVILAGDEATPLHRVVGHPALVWIGGLSYSLYLWHWPLITIAHVRWPTFSLPQVALVAAASVGLAWVSQRVVENPVRFAPWFRARTWRPFGLALVCVLLSVGAGASLVVAGPSRSLVAPAGARPQGAAVLPGRIDLRVHPAWSQGVAWVLPAPQDALADVPAAYDDSCQQGVPDSTVVSCDYGDRSATRTVALVGDSKAVQWLPALDTWAQGHRLRLVLLAKSSCPFADTLVDLAGAPYRSCQQWNTAVAARLLQLRPELVVTSQVRQGASASLGDAAQGQRLMTDALARTWRTLTDALVPVVVLADTPQVGHDVYACVAENPDHLARCEYDRAAAVAASAAPPQLAATVALGGVRIDASGTVTGRRGHDLALVDLTDAVCPDAVSCPPVVGNALIYRSGSHITKTYVDTLAPRLGALLDKAVTVEHP